ncbi:MAG: diguanylate cyclase, partial [Cellulomonas sp.]|nr:diguanylate cyclase [Cellulomonas sp.]
MTAQSELDGPGFVLPSEVVLPAALDLAADHAPDVLARPLDLLAGQTPLLLTVSRGLTVEFVTGRLGRPEAVGRPVGEGFADLPTLVDELGTAVADGTVRGFDLEIDGIVLDAVVRPVLAGGIVRGAAVTTTDATAARASLRRTALLARMTAEHAAAQDDPDAVMQLVVRAVAEYVRAPVVLRSMQGDDLVLQAADDREAVPASALRQVASFVPWSPTARLREQLLHAVGPLTVPWSVWVEEAALPGPIRAAMVPRAARAVVCWPLRMGGELVGLLTVVAVRGSRMRVDTDPSEQRFLGDVAARAALHLETARLRAAAAAAAVALADSEARFRSAFDAAPVAMVLTGADPERPGRVIAVNDAYASLVGRPAAELVGVEVPDLVHPLDAAVVADLLAEVASGRLAQGIREHRVLRPDGSEGWVRMSVGLAAADEGGGQRQLVGHIEDITERKLAQEELARRALYDGLTGLANRHLAIDHLGRAVADLSRRPGRVAVVFVDLDRFKAINDTFGHEVGDQVLLEVATRLRGVVEGRGFAARIGGDEFLLICPQTRDDDELEQLLDRVLGVLEPPVHIATATTTTSINVGASVGVSLTTAARTRPDTMLHQADTAMYEAKRLGRQRYQIFEESLGQPASRWLRVEQDLRAAMADDRLVLHYQPIVELRTGRVRGVEALLRMVAPGGGLIPPGDFIDVAEESTLTYPLGRWVVDEACRQLAQWQRLPRKGPPLSMAVNVTGRQVADAARSGS